MVARSAGWKQFIETLPKESRLGGILLDDWRPRLAEKEGRLALRSVAPEALKKRLESNRDLLSAAIPHLGWLTTLLSGIPHVVFLTDADGIVLHSSGNDSARMADFGLFPGCDWSEDAVGPNGAGTALLHNRPVAVLGPEHAGSPLEDCTCAGAPLHAPDGALIGAIAINSGVQGGTPERLILLAHTAHVIGQDLLRAGEPHPSGTLGKLPQTVVSVLAASRTFEEAAGGILQALCQALTVNWGAIWMSERDAGSLLIAQIWHPPEERYADFDRISRAKALMPGASLVGRAYQLGAMTSLASDAEELLQHRAASAFAAGLNSGLAFPIRDGSHVVGIVELLGEHRIEENAELIAAIDTAASQFGLFVARMKTEAAVKDVEERYRALAASFEQRLQESLQAVDRRSAEFLGMLAHEVRNPLAPIRNALHLIRTQAGDSDVADKAYGMAERQLAHLTHVIDDVLDVSHLNRGSLPLNMEPLDLKGIVAAAAESMRGVFAAEQQELAIGLPPLTVPVIGDRTRMEQVVTKLLENASKFTPAGGKVGLAAGIEDGMAVITVKDNGRGIDPQALPHIFELFYQQQGALDGVQSGLGIGLHLVRRLTELHDGNVQATSEGIDKGSEFVVRLPVAAGDAEAVGASENVQQPLRVLIVDDNRDAAETTAMMMQLWQYKVKTANDGESALALAAEFMPEVVVLDLGLPRIPGEEVAKRLRALRGFEKVLIVALTGYDSTEGRQHTREAGFDCHLAKPVDPKVLESILVDFARARNAHGRAKGSA